MAQFGEREGGLRCVQFLVEMALLLGGLDACSAFQGDFVGCSLAGLSEETRGYRVVEREFVS